MSTLQERIDATFRHEPSILSIYGIDPNADLKSFIQEEISRHDTELAEKVRVMFVLPLKHDEFCKAKGDQFKECARCFNERKWNELLTTTDKEKSYVDSCIGCQGKGCEACNNTGTV